MIISQQKGSNRQQREKWAIFLGTVALILFSTFLFLSLPQKTTIFQHKGIIFCDAETVKGEHFVYQSHQFTGGSFQSNEKAFSGQFSCKTPIGEGNQYALKYELRSGKAGDIYKISVWRNSKSIQAGRLIIQNSGGVDYYKMEEIPVAKGERGWEKLEATFQILFGQSADFYKIYVYGNGKSEVFFDDLRIEKIENDGSHHFKPQVLNLKIPPKPLRKLEKQRKDALEKGHLLQEDKNWVKAYLLDSTSNHVPIKLRLKGDKIDHLEANKWSFRIKIKDPHAWQASTNDQKRLLTFSVHTPAARYYLSEWLLHQFWKQEGVLTTDYDFTHLNVNGKSFGVYAFEEHFEKQLVESQGRREGVIVKFSEDGFWAGIDRQLQNHGYVQLQSKASITLSENAAIEAFGEDKIYKSPTLSKQYEAARKLMFAYQNGLKAAEEIFDIDKLARYFAIADIFNAYHAIIWHNQRFYFNPILGKLEPIGFDGFGGKPSRKYGILGEGAMNPDKLAANRLFGYLLQEKSFNQLYFKYLYKYSSRGYLAKFLAKHEIGWEKRLSFLQLEFPDYQPIYKDFLIDGLFVHSLILPFNRFSLRAFTTNKKGGKKQLKIQNSHHLPIEIIGFGYRKQKIDQKLETPLRLPAHIRRRYLSQLLRDSTIRSFWTTKHLHSEALALQEKGEIRTLTVSENARFLFFKIPGIDSVFNSAISPNNFITTAHFGEQPKTIPLKHWVDNNLFRIEGKTIIFRQGKHLISQALLIPKDYEVFIKAGTTFDFQNGAYLLSYSSIQAYGTAEQPIIFTSSDQTGKGVSILQVSKNSVFKHSVFDQLGALNTTSQQLPGAVNTYETTIHFEDCSFQNNHCEDALNIVRSDYVLANCNFQNTFADAFDSDFSKGEVINCTFKNIANDGMDFSGSIATIENCLLENCSDKGISAGEESDISVLDSEINHAVIAVASKDLSTLFLRNITIKNCDQGFVAFQKKPAYGPGYIIVESYTAKDVKRLKAIGTGSFLQIK